MDARSVFITVTLIVLANGSILSAVLFDAPSSLRPAARLWQWATLLVALALILFALEAYLPAGFEILSSNAVCVGALCLYHAAIRKFHGLSSYSHVYVLPVIGAVPFVYFAVAVPDIEVRIVIATILWSAIMASTAWVLFSRGRAAEFRSISGMTMTVIYVFAVLLMQMRAVIYLVLSADMEYAIADNSHWFNSLSPVLLSILPVVGTTTFLCMCTDQIKRRWQDAASRDPLTELPNRRALMAYGSATVESNKASAERVAVAILDVDNFKAINDNHGHDVGDLVLQQISAKIRTVLNADDFFARTGGEEFVLIFGRKGSFSPETSAERVLKSVADSPLWIGDTGIAVTASIGITLHNSAHSFNKTLSLADKALYSAKNNGRNQVVFSG